MYAVFAFQFYSILEMSEDMIFLHVDTPGGKSLSRHSVCLLRGVWPQHIYAYTSFQPLVAMIVYLYNVTEHLASQLPLTFARHR